MFLSFTFLNLEMYLSLLQNFLIHQDLLLCKVFLLFFIIFYSKIKNNKLIMKSSCNIPAAKKLEQTY